MTYSTYGGGPCEWPDCDVSATCRVAARLENEQIELKSLCAAHVEAALLELDARAAVAAESFEYAVFHFTGPWGEMGSTG